MSNYSKHVPGRQDMPYAPPRAGGLWQPPKAPSQAPPQAPPQAPNGTQLMAAVVVPSWGQPTAPPAGPGALPPRPNQASAPCHAPTPASSYAQMPTPASSYAQMPTPASPYAQMPTPASHYPQEPATLQGLAPMQHRGSAPHHAPAAPLRAPAVPLRAPAAPLRAPAAPNYAAATPAYAAATPSYAAATPNYPATQNYASVGTPNYPPAATPNYPPAATPNYPPAPTPNYPPAATPNYPATPSYASATPTYPPAPAPNYPPALAPHYAPVPQPPRAVGQAEAAAMSVVPTRQAAPGCAHAYPLAVRTTGVFAATKLALKTLPYALFRFGQASLFSLVTTLLLCLATGLAFLLGKYVHPFVGVAAMVAVMLAWFKWWSPFVEHKLFATSCGHVAILTELITKGQIGNGQQSMFAFGRELAATRLGELATVWAVYGTINDALCRVSNLLHFVDDLLPIDLGPVKRVLHRVVTWAAPYVEGVIVSYGLARGDRDFAHAGADGLCYSLQNAKSLFKTALGVLVLEQLVMLPARLAALLVCVPGVFYAAYVALGGDVAGLRDVRSLSFMEHDLLTFIVAIFAGCFLGGAFSLLAVKAIKESFVKPALLTMVMVKFHVAIENQPLDAGLKERTFKANEGLAKLDDLRATLRRAGV